MHSLFHFEFKFKLLLELELTLESKLELELPYRVIKAELLAVVTEDALSLRSLRIRSTSRAPAKLEEIG